MSQRNLSRMIEGISDPDALRRFEVKLQQRYKIKKLGLSTESHVLRARFCLDCETDTPVTMQIWSSDNILIQGSPKIPPRGFNTEVSEVFVLAESSIEATPDPETTPYMLRARTLLAYIKRLDVGDEIDRMVVVTLGDIVLDLLLCHKMDTYKMKREEFEISIPRKISELNKTEEVYRDDDIEKAHRLRNRIAHRASLITEEEAIWVKEIIEDVIEHI